MTERPRSIPWRRVGLALVASLLAVESVLQLGALVVWALGTSPERTSDRSGGRAEVVCLGDSFTYGIGAGSRAGAYPSQLAVRLRERLDREVEVVNMGWPGSDSMDVLRRLPKALDLQPRVVCVLIGCNDRWRRRGLAADRLAGSGAFPLECRTLRLLRILLHGRGLFETSGGEVVDVGSPAVEQSGTAGKSEPDGGAELLGTWTVLPNGVPARFDAAGRCQIGPAVYEWVWEGSGAGARLTLADPTGSLPVERFVPTRVAAGWLLESASGQHLALTPSDAVAVDFLGQVDLLRGAERARVDGDVVGARDRYRNLLAQAELRTDLRDRAQVGLLELGPDGGLSAADQARIVAELRQRAGPGARAVDIGSAMRALVAVGAWEDAIELFDRASAESVEIGLELHLAALGIVCEHAAPEQVAARVERALAVAGSASGAKQWIYGEAIRVFKEPIERAEWIARAIQEVDDPAWLDERLCSLQDGVDPDLVLASFRRAGLDAGGARALLERWRAAHSATAAGLEWDEVLGLHLAEIAAQCRQRGAQLVILTYPFEQAEVQSALRSFGARASVPSVDMRKVFPRGAEEREPLFVSDGHCSDAGYALMAEQVAEPVARLLAR